EDSMAYRKGQHLYFTTMHQENSWQGSEWIPLGQAQNLFTVMSFVLDGVPMIYNGQEEPLERSIRFYDKDTIAFENLGHAGFLSELIRLRTSHQALFPGEKGGRMTALQTTHADQVLAFKRKVPGDELICLFNCSNKPVSCNLVEGLDKAKYLEHFSKKKTALQPGHAIELEPWAYKIFIRQ
ncbi:MAG TPA: alpha-glucosidase C-terminal domain-containing protein, partial [Saprospiraceae bacterium]|nr:alpha-glucosidase C-terminal domain-containing protein [Saprospiraceae bacterium]